MINIIRIEDEEENPTSINPVLQELEDEDAPYAEEIVQQEEPPLKVSESDEES